MPLCTQAEQDSGNVMDHVFWFNAARPVAIVVMPYHAEGKDVRAIAERYGLNVQTPPVARSGWWLPGGQPWSTLYVRPAFRKTLRRRQSVRIIARGQ
jgi:hypothetical protein